MSDEEECAWISLEAATRNVVWLLRLRGANISPQGCSLNSLELANGLSCTGTPLKPAALLSDGKAAKTPDGLQAELAAPAAGWGTFSTGALTPESEESGATELKRL